MTPQNTFQPQPVHRASMSKRMLQGAGVAFVLILIFLLSAGAPDPAWGKLWMLSPLMMVPVAGALGGIFSYYMDHMQSQASWVKTLAIVLSLTGYAIILWRGTVLGLNGTLWD